MSDKKQKCKVIRSFFLEGKQIPASTPKKPVYIDLDESFAREMKASLKVEFVGETTEAEPEAETDK